MDTNRIKNLTQKFADGTATEKEKVGVLRELNTLIEKYNELLKEALAQNQ